jgi:Bifunctional DNA primase/polymerase, N-terminal
MTRADLAISYAQRGWAVFPLQVGLKQPLPRSRGFYAGISDIVSVRQWWRNTDYNIGIWTGGSDLVVIDLDIDKDDPSSWARGGATPGISWWLEMCSVAEYDWEQTYCVVTASGGMHVYFTSEKPYPPAVGKFGALVDVRAGNSYVVAAGSSTDVGEFEHICSDQVQPVPEWLDALLDPLPIKTIAPLEQLRRDSEPGAYRAAIEGLSRVLQSSGEGERNNTFNWCCVKVGAHWWSEDQREDALSRLQAIGSAVGLTEKEMNDTIKSAQRAWPAR